MGIDAPNYTQIPNAILGNLLKGNKAEPGLMATLEGSEFKVLLAVCRLTFGYHKNCRRASLTTIQELTSLSRQGVLNAAKSLEAAGLIKRTKDGGITIWEILVNSVDQKESEQVVNSVDQQKEPELVNSVDQGVNSVDQQSQLSRLPSKKETRKKTQKKAKEEQPKSVAPLTPNDHLFNAFLTASKIPAPKSLTKTQNWQADLDEILDDCGGDVALAVEVIGAAVKIVAANPKYTLTGPASIQSTCATEIGKRRRQVEAPPEPASDFSQAAQMVLDVPEPEIDTNRQLLDRLGQLVPHQRHLLNHASLERTNGHYTLSLPESSYVWANRAWRQFEDAWRQIGPEGVGVKLEAV